jgi:galacturonosyltransferase
MNKRVLILVNHEIVIYNFRKELVFELLKEGYEVYISSPKGKKIDILVESGAKHIDTHINRHGISVFEDFKLMRFYTKTIRELKPLVVLTYTIKPNIYGGFAAKKNKVPYIANITGLGTAVERKGILQFITKALYKRAFKKIHTVFFQNEENMSFFIKNKIAIGKHALLPGSGVNLEEFKYLDYPNDDVIRFAFISRIMKEKGIDLYLEAAKEIKKIHPNTEFHVCGFCEQEYEIILDDLTKRGIIVYHGMVDDVRSMLSNIHCVVHPSYYPEGMSNVLLEAASSGRPIITSNRSGCQETVEDNVTGFLVKKSEVGDYYDIIMKFIKMDNSSRKTMGINGRNKMIISFNRNIVITEYVSRIEKIYNKPS